MFVFESLQGFINAMEIIRRGKWWFMVRVDARTGVHVHGCVVCCFRLCADCSVMIDDQKGLVRITKLWNASNCCHGATTNQETKCCTLT